MSAPPRQPGDPYGYAQWAWDQIARLGADLRGTEALVLLALAQHGNADGIARPSARTLAARIGRTETIVRRAFRVLEAHGLIEQLPDPHRKVKVWRLLADPQPLRTALSATRPAGDADNGVRNPGDACGPDADQMRTAPSPEGEGEETTPPVAPRGGRTPSRRRARKGRLEPFDPTRQLDDRSLAAYRSVGINLPAGATQGDAEQASAGADVETDDDLAAWGDELIARHADLHEAR